MSATICPTILAAEPHGYRTQIERLEPFATRLHIDVADGSFAPATLSLDHVWWPANVLADMHIMYQHPAEQLAAIIALAPRLAIIHAEASGNFNEISSSLKHHGIEVGLALMADTPVAAVAPVIGDVDHVLLFSGHLGKFGGQANLSLLTKATELKKLKPSLEIGWDGGVNDHNAKQLSDGSIDVLNVGGFIQRAVDPVAAYAKLGAALID